MNTTVMEQVIKYALDQAQTSHVNVLNDITGFGYDSAEYFEYQRSTLKELLNFACGVERDGLSAEDEMVIALSSFQRSARRLLLAWEQYDINNFEANELYPFADSFDELEAKIDDWIRATQFELANS